MKHQIDRLESMLKDYQDLQKMWINNSDCCSPGYYEKAYRGLEQEELEIKHILQDLRDLYQEKQVLNEQVALFESMSLSSRLNSQKAVTPFRWV